MPGAEYAAVDMVMMASVTDVAYFGDRKGSCVLVVSQTKLTVPVLSQ